MSHVQGSKMPQATFLDPLPAGPQVQPFQTFSTCGYEKPTPWSDWELSKLVIYWETITQKKDFNGISPSRTGDLLEKSWILAFLARKLDSHGIQTSKIGDL